MPDEFQFFFLFSLSLSLFLSSRPPMSSHTPFAPPTQHSVRRGSPPFASIRVKLSRRRQLRQFLINYIRAWNFVIIYYLTALSTFPERGFDCQTNFRIGFIGISRYCIAFGYSNHFLLWKPQLRDFVLSSDLIFLKSLKNSKRTSLYCLFTSCSSSWARAVSFFLFPQIAEPGKSLLFSEFSSVCWLNLNYTKADWTVLWLTSCLDSLKKSFGNL